jgi:hypothetical protein
MLARIWLVLAVSILLLRVPGVAQRTNAFGSRGSFGGRPMKDHFGGSGRFAPGAHSFFTRPPSSYGFRRPRSLPFQRSLREPEFNFRGRIPRGSFVPRPPDRPSDVSSPRQSGEDSESRGPFNRESASQPPVVRQESIQRNTERASVSVPRPPLRVMGTTSSMSTAAPARFQGRSRFVPRPPLPSATTTDASTRFTNTAKFAMPGSRGFVSSRFLFRQSPSAQPFVFSRPMVFSSRSLFFASPFNPFLRRPFFFSSFFFNPFFFDPFLFSPFNPFFFNPFFNPFFFQPFLFSPSFYFEFFFPQPFFFSVSFSNAFLFPQPPLFSPFFSRPFLGPRPFLVSWFSQPSLVLKRPFDF